MRDEQIKSTKSSPPPNTNTGHSDPIPLRPARVSSGTVTIEEWERWRILAARIVIEYGPRYGGRALRRIERELAIARAEDPTARALKVLADAGIEIAVDENQPRRRGRRPARAPSLDAKKP